MSERTRPRVVEAQDTWLRLADVFKLHPHLLGPVAAAKAKLTGGEPQ